MVEKELGVAAKVRAAVVRVRVDTGELPLAGTVVEGTKEVAGREVAVRARVVAETARVGAAKAGAVAGRGVVGEGLGVEVKGWAVVERARADIGEPPLADTVAAEGREAAD